MYVKAYFDKDTKSADDETETLRRHVVMPVLALKPFNFLPAELEKLAMKHHFIPPAASESALRSSFTVLPQLKSMCSD